MILLSSGSPEQFRKALCFTTDVFICLLRQEICEIPLPIAVKLFPRDQYVGAFYNPRSKFRGLPRNMGSKTCKIWGDFTQLPTLIANMSGKSQDVQHEKDM